MIKGFVSYRWFAALILASCQLFTLPLYGGVPGLKFIENKNQWNKAIQFGAKVPGGNLFISPHGFQYLLTDERKLEAIHEQSHHHFDESTGSINLNEKIDNHYVRMQWIAGNASTPQPFGKSKTYYNYFHGADPSQWSSKAFAYDGITYPSLYDGIDLMVYSSGIHLKYDFMVSAGADPLQIKGMYEGAYEIELDDNGNLYVTTSVGQLIEKRPYAYQFINGVKTQVVCDFVLEGSTVSFCFPQGYDTCEPLIIDPLLIFSTYSGSTADNWGSTATPGENGNLYSAGVTSVAPQTSFPATPGAFQTAYGGQYDVGILKYDSTGRELLWASYLGGDFSETPHSLVMNDNEELLVLGTTSSLDFPTTANAIQRTFAGGTAVLNASVQYLNGTDIYVTRISKDGSEILASTYLGGTANDGVNPPGGPLTKNYGDELRGDIITNADGDIFISTVTSSTDFSVTNSFNMVYKGGVTDALLLKLPADLSSITWGAFIGGTGDDASHTLKLDKQGDIFIAGGTNSDDFPVTSNTYQPIKSGNEDGWIAHVAGDGSAIINATFTGTAGFDQIYFIDLNENEEIYTYGQTTGGLNFPVTAGVYNNPNSGQFVQKFSNDLSTLIFSTVFGSGRGIPDISPTAFLVNECNNLYMSGWGGLVNSNTEHWQSNTIGMPLTPDAFQRTTSGSDFYFMVLTDDATQFLYGTYLGGNFSRTHVDGGTSRFDKSGIVYHAVCSGCAAYNATDPPVSTSDFPTTPNAWSRVNRSTNCNNAAFKFDLSSLRARLQSNSLTLDMPGLTSVCIPGEIVFQNLSTGGEIFQWDLGDGTRIVKPDTSMVVHQYQNTGRYIVKLKAIDPGTCKVSDSTATYVDVYIKQSQVQDDDDLCEDTSYKLQASGGVGYRWISEDGTFQSAEATPTVSPLDTLQYYVTITEATGCINQDTVQLNVIPSLLPGFELTIEGQCKGIPIIHVQDTTQNTENAQLFFDFGDGTTSDEIDVTHTYEKNGLYTVKLTGVREFCVYEATKSVPIFEMTVPNVITPAQKEGKNDTFVIQYGRQEGVTPGDYGIKVSLIVYNRWGKKVYEASDYKYDWSAEGLAAGVYYYDVTVDGHATCKSWVQVIK